MLAWIPFLQPAPSVSSYWWALVFPLSIGVSMAWRAVRQKDLHGPDVRSDCCRHAVALCWARDHHSRDHATDAG